MYIGYIYPGTTVKVHRLHYMSDADEEHPTYVDEKKGVYCCMEIMWPLIFAFVFLFA